MTNKIPNISEAEWEIMKVLWREPNQTANEVISAIQKLTDWNPKTIRTLLDRLTKKNVVSVNKEHKVYTFSPLFSQDDCQRVEAQSFIQRIYDGTMKSMIVQFLEEDSLSKEDIKELRAILDEKSNE